MIFKKGQVALEFLMTYGWAILVVLVAIGALAYFGVLSPDRFLPSRCTLPAGLACTDFVIDSVANTITVSLRNGLGYDLSGVTIAVGQCGESAATTLNNGELKSIVSAACAPVLVAGAKFNTPIQVKYTNVDSNIPHTINGTMTGRVE